MHFALNILPSPQKGNFKLIEAFLGREQTPPISTILQTSTNNFLQIDDVKQEQSVNVEKLVECLARLRPVAPESLDRNRKKERFYKSDGQIPKFREGDFVLVAREKRQAGQKLMLRWREPRRIRNSLNDYRCEVGDLRTRELLYMHATHLEFYRDCSLNTDAFMSHVLSTKTGIIVSRFLRLEGLDGKPMLTIR